MSQVLDQASGQCLCGTVQYEITGQVAAFHVCYCSRCRHSTGSAHAANLFTAPENITWLSGTDQIQRFELETAKSFAKQFCKVCGSAVPYINRAGTTLLIPAGGLNGNLDLTPDDKIFCADRCTWVENIPDSPEFAALPTTS